MNKDYPEWEGEVMWLVLLGTLFSMVIELCGVSGVVDMWCSGVLSLAAAGLVLTLGFGVGYYLLVALFAPVDAKADWGKEYVPFWLR